MPHRIYVAHIVQIENDFNDRPQRWYASSPLTTRRRL
jgi:hypothetical protein